MAAETEIKARHDELHARIVAAEETLAALEESNVVALAHIREQFAELAKMTAKVVDIDADLWKIKHGMTSLRTVLIALMDDTERHAEAKP